MMSEPPSGPDGAREDPGSVPVPRPVDDPRDMRCSDADREVVAEAVREAAADGRLTLGEMSDRLDVVYAARTYRDLEPVVHDLPGAHVPGVPGLPVPRPESVPVDRVVTPVVGQSGTTDSAVAIFSETKRTGSWVVPADCAGVAVFGSVVLDLREASLAASTVQIQANAVFGEVKVIVDDGLTVSTVGTPVLGEYNGPHEQPRPDRPHVILNGLALFGSVEVKRKASKRRSR